VPEGFEVHGHRGARGLAPENTLAAFERALDLGVDALEGDLHLTADSVLVLVHDAYVSPSLCRLDEAAPGPPAPDPDRLGKDARPLLINAHTFAQLERYRCARRAASRAVWEPTTGEDYRIRCLEQLVALVSAYAADDQKPAALRERATRVRFNLELKRGDDEQGEVLAEAAIAAITRHGLESRVLLQSFDAPSLVAVHRLAPSIARSYLTRSPFSGPESAAKLGADYWSPSFRYLTKSEVRAAHALGLRLLPYTVDEVEDLRAVLALGVDGIISDRPDRLLALVGRWPRIAPHSAAPPAKP
jgi:glycerophosphoryl diester phosphodiesterase